MGLRCAMNRSGLSQAVRNMEAEKPKCPLCDSSRGVRRNTYLNGTFYTEESKHSWECRNGHDFTQDYEGYICGFSGWYYFNVAAERKHNKPDNTLKHWNPTPQQIRVKRIDHDTVPAVVEGLDENFEPKTETLMVPRNRRRKMDANGNWIEKTDDGPGLLARAVFWVVTSVGGTAAGWAIQYWWNQGW